MKKLLLAVLLMVTPVSISSAATEIRYIPIPEEDNTLPPPPPPPVPDCWPVCG